MTALEDGQSNAEAASNSRRAFFSKTTGSAALVALGLMDAPQDAKALGSLKKVNAKLSQ